MGDKRRQKPFYESSEVFLMTFFVRILLLILDAPESLLDELEEAIKLSREQREELQRRLGKMLEEKEQAV